MMGLTPQYIIVIVAGLEEYDNSNTPSPPEDTSDDEANDSKDPSLKAVAYAITVWDQIEVA